MRNDTRLHYNAYTAQIAALNGIPDATVKFAVEPTIQQKLEDKIQESSDFLTRINVIGVHELKGERLGLSVGSPIASTTDTNAKDRATKDPSALDAQQYECTQTNSDTHITYAKLDAWAKFPDFQTRVRDAILRQQARDRIIIGFNGKSRAATSNPTTNPLLQDVNKGWLQHYREKAPQRVLNKGATVGVIKVGNAAGCDYRNLDALVFDAVNHLIEPWFQEDTELVAMCGRNLLADKYFPLVNNNDAPSEKLAADLIISQKRLGNLPAVRVPFLPAGTILVTRYDNLSIYYQEGSRRRAITDNPKRDRIENWESSNDAYVVEDFGAGCLIENVQVAGAAL
ncbi:phage major capsid protein, P2 family [Lysobacter arvi]|uniref:Phage major capsid protein, P2 family n=1 Tax=Lysobacter arvi TaxID=3038776 RepID=A0ABU1CB55_9GAMM|nr:phage major capsid protein, P2 family [Lysobacter arvi]MDR0182397.1 phage major capsid protein, P2 family [Lysobacter arvi]